MDKGTIIRTIVLVVALINQMLVMWGRSPLPIENDDLELLLTGVFTVVASLVAWFKNNYVTAKGGKQKEVLKKSGLTKAK
ncbi:phage holin [Virgibacillus flavescens]|uniref:phage holin n=1 Tax=Virgibacillus flavescens TaxID=1611422 RepID=UPI003D32810B